jgi:2-oxoglutarate ferredoxin oxidoreductase subunit beta
VTFNNHEGSTKSYKYAKESEELLHEIGFVPFYEQITVDYEPGLTKVVEMHDGSRITLKKLERDYNPSDKAGSLRMIRDSNSKGEFLTGLLYVDPLKPDFTEVLNMHDEALATLEPERIRPPREALEEIMESLR